jgi:hypothetical protein
MRQSIRWICATSMMDRNDRHETGEEPRSNRSDPRHVHRHTVDSCPVAQLTWVPAMMLPQGRCHHPSPYNGRPCSLMMRNPLLIMEGAVVILAEALVLVSVL